MAEGQHIDTDTLAESERRLGPVALGVFVMCCVADLALLAWSSSHLPLVGWLALDLLCLAPLASDLWCLRRNGPGIGLMPVAAFSLAPALCSALPCLRPGGGAWWACLVVTLAALGVLATFCWWFWRLRGAWAHSPAVADDAVVVVLGGLVRGGVPVRTVRSRLRVAAGLWREAPGRTLVLTGGPTPDGTTTEADAMARWLIAEEGLPEGALILEREAINTEQNLRNARALMDARGLAGRQVCVVSSDYHLFRARELARRLGMDVACVPAPVPLGSALQQWSREVLVILARL